MFDRLLTHSAIALAILVSPLTLLAQESDYAIEEITVTAQKRAESVQDVPLAISAFDETFLRESGVVDAAGLVAYTPGLNGQSYQDTESVFTIRGIGTQAFGIGADNAVGMFIDDQPIGRTTLIGNSFFDLKRVEVVKGPQGTLFGRNASAGAISLITNKPDMEENSLDVLLSAGNEGQQTYEVIGNLAASDRFGARLAVRHDERDGTFSNSTNGDELNNRNHTNVRLSLQYDLSDNVVANFVAEDIQVETRTAAAALAQAFDDEITINRVPKQEIDANRYTLKVAWDINDSMALTSNTSFLDYDLLAIPVDADVTDLFIVNLLEPQEGDQFAQEFRLNGGTDRVDWFVGASFINEQISSSTTHQYTDNILTQLLLEDFTICDNNPPVPCQAEVNEINYAATDNTSVAVYADVAWQITDRAKLTVGGRYTRDEKDFTLNTPVVDSLLALVWGDNFFKTGTDGLIGNKMSWSSFDPRLALDFSITDDVMLYGSATSGYKSGGFNSAPDRTLAEGVEQNPAPFDEEEVAAYEIGIKSQFWDGRAQLNVAAFFNDYTNFQLEDASNLVIVIQNAGDVETKGIEIDGTFLLTENLTLLANFSKMEAEFTNGSFLGADISGNAVPRSPETSGSAIINYVWPLGNAGDLSLRGEYIYTDSFFFDVSNVYEQDSYSLTNARIAYRSPNDRWGLALVGENLTDEEYLVHLVEVLEPVGFPGMGRLYRAELNFRF
jgi:iron complex outermembrane receptor protein